MRIVFFGTPEFAVPSLETLLRLGVTVVAVVTQPDRPRGRSRSTLEPPPVKVRALAAGIPVLQPERPTGPEFLDLCRGFGADLGVVVAYGHLLRPALLGIPRLGMINVHASLLPRWRGAAPIQWAVAHGDPTTGVTIMRMEVGLDSGPVLLAKETPIGPTDTGGELTARLGTLGAVALHEAIDRFRNGTAVFQPQDSSRVTLAPKIGREVARIDWTKPADDVANGIRAFDPVPGSWTTLAGRHLKCFAPRPVKGNGRPGTVLWLSPGLVVAAGTEAVAIGQVQPAGKPRMNTLDWLRGRPLAIGDQLG